MRADVAPFALKCIRVYTYFDNFQLFRRGLITSRLRPRLQALKRKRVFAENQARR